MLTHRPLGLFFLLVLTFSLCAAAQGVSFQTSNLPIQVRAEGLTETIGAVVLQAMTSGNVAGGSTITISYAGGSVSTPNGVYTFTPFVNTSITNTPSNNVLNCNFAVSSNTNCTGETGSTAGAGMTVSYSGNQLVLTFTGNSSVLMAFSASDYIEISRVRVEVNPVAPQYDVIGASVTGTSSTSANPISFTPTSVVVGSLVSPSLGGSVSAASTPIATCAVANQTFSVSVKENYPAALTSLSDENSFTPNTGSVSNGTQILVTISNVPAGLAVTPGTPVSYSGSNALVGFASTPAAITSTGTDLTFVYTVTSDNTANIDGATLPFTIGMPAGSSATSIPAVGGTFSVTASVGLGPVQSASTTVAFVPNTSLSGTVATINVCPQATLTPQSATSSAGAATAIPLALVLNGVYPSGALVSVDSMAFGVQVAPNGGAPAIVSNISFSPAAGLPPSPITTNQGANQVGVYFPSFNPPLSGILTLGVLHVSIPSGAPLGQSYAVHITAVSASRGNQPVTVTVGPDATITLTGYLVGDTSPHTADSVGNFGDGVLNTLDLIDALRAVTNISTPASCSDRFDAIDAAPVDTPSLRGGDGKLNTLDLIATLRRVTNLDTSRPSRAPRGLTCPSSVAQTQARTAPRIGPVHAVVVISGDELYLEARQDLNLAGLALSLRLPDGQQANFTPGAIAASLVDVGAAGQISIAWLNGIKLDAGGKLLLGSVNGADRGTLHGVSANNVDGREVTIR